MNYGYCKIRILKRVNATNAEVGHLITFQYVLTLEVPSIHGGRQVGGEKVTRTEQLSWLFFFAVFEICFIAGLGATLMTLFEWWGLIGLPFLFAAGVLTWYTVLDFIDTHFAVEKVTT